MHSSFTVHAAVRCCTAIARSLWLCSNKVLVLHGGQRDASVCWLASASALARYHACTAHCWGTRAPSLHTSHLTPRGPAEKFYEALARGQVPVVLGARNLVEHAPSRDSYVDVRDYASVAALAAHLRYLDTNETAYDAYHAWRSLPFASYGRQLAPAMMQWVSLANWTGIRPGAVSSWYACAMCDALQRDEAGAQTVPDQAPPSCLADGVRSFSETCEPAWSEPGVA